jgi:uncharacterized repeat protein (TIGR03803 family)
LFSQLYDFFNGLLGNLVVSSNTIYGTTLYGGDGYEGTVFAVNIDGTGFTNLHDFAEVTNNTNSDGGDPMCGLVLAGNTLYGTTSAWGPSSNGTLFAVNIDGTSFANMHSFTGGADGSTPLTGLALSGSTLYGSTFGGGTNFTGTMYAINTDGTGFATLMSFCCGIGSLEFENLSFSSNVLYGMSPVGGKSSGGTVYAVNSDGADFRVIYNFTNALPKGALIVSGDTLYGTTYQGGGNGTVFSIQTDGSGFRVLHFFGVSDGSQPVGGLVLSGNTLYGTTTDGGAQGFGTIFQVNTDSTGFARLYSFTNGSDGLMPQGGLVLVNNILYGTSWGDGPAPEGTVFSLSLPTASRAQLSVTLSGTNIVLTWPATGTESILQSTTNLDSQTVWTTVSSSALNFNGQYAATNIISGAQRFFRLVHP